MISLKSFTPRFVYAQARFFTTNKSTNVLVLVSDGSEEIETVTVVDVLRRAGALVELSKVD